MKIKRKLLIALLLYSSLAGAEENKLAWLLGKWVSVTEPIGQVFLFVRDGFGTTTRASLPNLPGLALITVSNGDYGSNIRVSGVGYTCYYLITQLSQNDLAMGLMGGSPVCPPNHYLKREPLP